MLGCQVLPDAAGAAGVDRLVTCSTDQKAKLLVDNNVQGVKKGMSHQTIRIGHHRSWTWLRRHRNILGVKGGGRRARGRGG